MTMAMRTSTVTAIDADAIRYWIAEHLAPLCPAGSEISVINGPLDCKGPSRFFAAVEVEKTITVEQLRQLVATEHSRAHYLHFYVDDVISAAVGSGALSGDFFHVYYQW